MKDRTTQSIIRNFVIELVIYGLALVIYFIAVLRLLGNFLTRLYDSQLVVYAIVALGLIVLQGVLLDFVTSFVMKQLKLDSFE